MCSTKLQIAALLTLAVAATGCDFGSHNPTAPSPRATDSVFEGSITVTESDGGDCVADAFANQTAEAPISVYLPVLDEPNTGWLDIGGWRCNLVAATVNDYLELEIQSYCDWSGFPAACGASADTFVLASAQMPPPGVDRIIRGYGVLRFRSAQNEIAIGARYDLRD